MSKTRTLFLTRQNDESDRWFPVGRLDADLEGSAYRFRYTRGVRHARGGERGREDTWAVPLLEFSCLQEDYRSKTLFPIFQIRVMAKGRPDRTEYLRSLGLQKTADPIDIMSVSGGRRMTDSFGVVPKLLKRPDDTFSFRFFPLGVEDEGEAASRLEEGEELRLALKPDPVQDAVRVLSADGQRIGLVPPCLVSDMVPSVAESPEFSAKVAQVNPEAPSRHRVLVEMNGPWMKPEPMTSEDFTPLVE